MYAVKDKKILLACSANHYFKKDNCESDYKQYSYKAYGNDYDKRYTHKKKKSFLNDFFDF